MSEEELREQLITTLDRHQASGWLVWGTHEIADAVLALPAVRELLAAAEAVQRVESALAALTEAVGRGDEYGLPEAYRAALRALDGDQ